MESFDLVWIDIALKRPLLGGHPDVFNVLLQVLDDGRFGAAFLSSSITS